MEKRCEIGGGEGGEGGRGRTWSPGVGPRENKLSGWFWSKFSSAKCVYGGLFVRRLPFERTLAQLLDYSSLFVFLLKICLAVASLVWSPDKRQHYVWEWVGLIDQW
ncbi:unnamed protein product [Citrullus colocynthis]|uniref:Uncharacterized protein n=1 Tax=Citrullus colocynthis TaxID=252529 RepID=A0ABP0YV92_9ROSI